VPADEQRPSNDPSFLELVLVERDVYWRVLSLDYQAEQFEVFHRSALTRWTHYVGTHLIVWAFLLLTVRATIGAVPVAVLLAIALIAWYVRLDRVVGLVAGLDVVVLLGLAALASGRGLTPLTAVVVLVVVAAAQNVSHSVEPVPPVLTGRGFEPFPVFWSQASAWHRVRIMLLNVFYLPLELVSAPRLFPVHAMRAMHKLGWRPEQAAEVESRALAILGAA
jgi:uncharacterized membrane protein (UPF0136 family)